MKARNVFAAMVACLAAVGFAAVLGTGAPSAGAAGACPNEAIRAQQHAQDLAECRAWEMVSPVDKNGGEVFAEGVNTFASTSGDAFTYDSHNVFGDAAGSGAVGITTYLAKRTPGGWLSRSITPASRPNALQVLPARTQTEVFSDDLSHSLATGYDLPGAPGSTPERINLYVEDTTDRSLRTVSTYQRPGEELGKDFPPYFLNELINGKELWGASADLQHVAWATGAQLLPADPSSGYPQGSEELPGTYNVKNLYTWDDGVIHLAGILPDGTLPPGGSQVEPEGPGSIQGTMSADGSRQTFVASPTSGAARQLYLRIDNSRTDWISEPENGGEPGTVYFEGMTPDGKNVFFVSESPLLEEDEADGPDLYRWREGPDPAHEDNLTLITDTGSAVHAPGSLGGALVGMSDDGNRVYVTENSDALTVWDEGVTKVVDPFVPRGGDTKKQLTVTSTRPGFGRVSPDGNWLAYINRLGGNQLYLYNREEDQRVCITCAAGVEDVSVFPVMSRGSRVDNVAARPRFLSNDGRVFFSTATALVSADVNSVYDVYEYDGPSGELHLLSSGRGSEPAMFAEASPSGNDVFFATRQALVGSDTDGGALDFYDARAGGGFAEPEPGTSACLGEGCQGSASAPPGAGAAASAKLHGAGNVKPKKPCRKGTRRVRNHGRTRCVKKHRHHGRAAHTKQGSHK